MFKMFSFPTFTSFVVYPIKEKRRVAPFCTLRLYLPSISVIVPVVVPLTETETPGIVSPSLSITTPEIFIS